MSVDAHRDDGSRLVVRSCWCRIRWLQSVLKPQWFGGGDYPIFNPRTFDVRIVRLDKRGHNITGRA